MCYSEREGRCGRIGVCEEGRIFKYLLWRIEKHHSMADQCSRPI